MVVGYKSSGVATVQTLLADPDKATLSDFDDDHSAALVQWLSSRQPRLATDDQ